jgi:SAM-dependent methyltransferase
MTTQSSINPWSDDETARLLRLRMKTLWNLDYFEKIVLPLLHLPKDGQVLDVGCGNGGMSFLFSEQRPDLLITGVTLSQHLSKTPPPSLIACVALDMRMNEASAGGGHVVPPDKTVSGFWV